MYEVVRQRATFFIPNSPVKKGGDLMPAKPKGHPYF
jgi:hypothetical protein